MVALKWLERHFEELNMLHVPCSNSSCRICTGGCEIFVPSRIALDGRNSFDGDGMGCLHRRIIVCS